MARWSGALGALWLLLMPAAALAAEPSTPRTDRLWIPIVAASVTALAIGAVLLSVRRGGSR